MAKLIHRLKVLEADKKTGYLPPFMIVVGEVGETDSQLLEIAEAEKIGRNVVKVVKEAN